MHLANSLLELLLMGRRASWPEALGVGAPALAASAGGAFVLLWRADREPLRDYGALGRTFEVEPASLVVALPMVAFATLELSPRFRHPSIPRRLMPVGGLLAGSFGGLSGHQGALRSAFLIRAGLDEVQFIATGVVIAAAVDVARLLVYSGSVLPSTSGRGALPLAAASLAAFAGALVGRRFLDKLSLRSLEIGVAMLMLLVALALGAGVL